MTSAANTRVAVNGAAGRMGRMLISAVHKADGLSLASALEHPDSPHIGADAGTIAGRGPVGVAIAADIDAALPHFDVLVDFSTPAATLAKLQACAHAGKGLVIGTTGFTADSLAAIRLAAEAVPVVMAPNMSIGMFVAGKLVEAAAQALGDDVDVEVIEAHHRHKVDAPSGTAVRLGEILASTLGRSLATDAVYGREGFTGERAPRAIGFHSLRGGDIVGEHTVVFAGTGERLEITHRAASRENFAAGAVRAAGFVADKLTAGAKGLFGMDAVLDL